MPCSDDGGCTEYIYKDGHDPHFRQEAERLKARVDELADLLCQAGRARHNKTNIPASVIQWWDEHCKLDKSRGQPW